MALRKSGLLPLLLLLSSCMLTIAAPQDQPTAAAAASGTPELPQAWHERLAALEANRDQEVMRMLEQVLTNQQTILRYLHAPAASGFGAAEPASRLGAAIESRSLISAADVPASGASGRPLAELAGAVQRPRSCRDIPDGMSGEETIYLGPGEPVEVYCDQDYEEGGWIVIQNRFDGFVNFNRSWEKYRDGFGDIGTEHWLGLDTIHRLTVATPHEIAFVAESFKGERRWARYTLFEIGGETDRYRLQKLGVYSGTLGDEFNYNKGMEFSTYDQDHDQYADVNCAVRTASGWWHRSCTRINLNGLYGNESGVRFAYWLDWLHLNGLKRTRIMIRELKRRK
ncbi:fibrinogen-like protein A isoform X2 [Anopheles albimanus]|uniref:fibrinogen-like protein A isoform X2 n=1 Tax=Anopheles albimanus TaxID=7167 RepID=UPI0016417906|nr:fibrinogen-like protein A isoform X2 [Anopheles albimanus]